MAEQKNSFKEREIGALWSRKKKDSNEKFLSGKLSLKKFGIDQEIEIVCLKNNYKEQDKHPDLKVYISEPRDGQKPAAAAPAATPARRPAASAPKAPPAAAPDDDQVF